MASSEPEYKLIYWPQIPGRAEPIRLLLEEVQASYVDVARTPDGVQTLFGHIDGKYTGDAGNPPILAPPILQHGDLTINQLPNILLYLARRHGLDGSSGSGQNTASPSSADDKAIYHVNELVLTALDGFYLEAHETHHPIVVSAVYEDQKAEAICRARAYRETRLPKFLGYFERVLSGAAATAAAVAGKNGQDGGPFLYGGRLTSADIALWQGVHGVKYAFPRAMQRLEQSGKYRRVFEHHEAFAKRERIAAYMASERRQQYGNGIWRCYPELDDPEEGGKDAGVEQGKDEK